MPWLHLIFEAWEDYKSSRAKAAAETEQAALLQDAPHAADRDEEQNSKKNKDKKKRRKNKKHKDEKD